MYFWVMRNDVEKKDKKKIGVDRGEAKGEQKQLNAKIRGS